MSNQKYLKIKDTVHTSLKSKKLQNLQEYCQQQNSLFVDEEFPPEFKSLVNQQVCKDYRGQWKDITWARASQIFGERNYDLFKGVSPQDILQGNLGNCYFLCSLASLAEYPELVTRLFDFDHVNPQGIQSVWLNINGAWQQIVLDEYFPAMRSGQNFQLAFSQTNQAELWVLLLEKAYAKAYGSYWEIVGGDPVHALRDLTGAPYDRIEDFSNLNVAWEKIMDANIKFYMLTCFTKSTEVVEEKNDLGIVAGHAYTILDARNIVDSRGQPARILQIRNPWGKFEWNGDFSDSSQLWTNEQRQKFNIQKNDDGIFWMKLEDFIQYYEGIGILEIFPGAISNAILVNRGEGNLYPLRFQVEKNTHAMISIDQTDSRIVDNPDYSYSYFRVTIGKLEGDNIIFIDSVMSPERNIFVEQNFKPGNYILLVEAYWSGKQVKQFTVGTYSDYKINISQISLDEAKYKQTEYTIWKDYFKKNINQFDAPKTRATQDGSQLLTYQKQNQKFSHVLYGFVNNSNKGTIHQVLKIVQNQGFNIVGRTVNKNSVDVLMNPKDADIVLFKMDPRSQGFALQHQIQEEELLQKQIPENQQVAQLIQSLGGVQQTPDSSSQNLISQNQQKQNDQQNQQMNEQNQQLRNQKMEQRQREIADRREMLIREAKEQAEFMKNNGGMGVGMFNNLLDLGQQMQQAPQSDWGFNYEKHEQIQKQQKSICNIF